MVRTTHPLAEDLPLLRPTPCHQPHEPQHLICSCLLSSGHGWAGRLAGCVATGPFFLCGVFDLGQRVVATRGQTDMRGLVTAGRAVRLERSAALESNVTTGVDHERWLFIGVSRVVPRAAT